MTDRPGALPNKRAGTILAADFNEKRENHYSKSEWAFLKGGEHPCGEDNMHGPLGVLETAGFVNVSDVDCTRGAFSKLSGAPIFTHWTGTIVDYAYLHGAVEDQTTTVTVEAVYTIPTVLSDHLPTVLDVLVEW